MRLYQVKDELTGLFYKKGPAYLGNWVPQDEADIWTTKNGPGGVLGRVRRMRRKCKPIVEHFDVLFQPTLHEDMDVDFNGCNYSI